MIITPERAELIQEAKQLREFGYTQQMIADTLGVPQPTLTRWLKDVNNNNREDVNNTRLNIHINQTNNIHIIKHPITLYKCKYEEANLEPESFDLILTDPPYLVADKDISRTGQNHDLQRDYGEWDKTPQNEYTQNVKIWAYLMAKQLKQGGSLYLFMNIWQFQIWRECLELNGLNYAGIIIWNRTNPAPQMRQTRWCHSFDSILYFTKGAPSTFKWLGQNEMHNVLTGPICMGNEREYHPNQKPKWILERLIQVSTIPRNNILDPFSGSGSTAFASSRLPGRHVTLVEPDPQWNGLIQGIAKKENIDIRIL